MSGQGGSVLVVDVGTQDELQERCALFRLLLSGPGEDAEGIEAISDRVRTKCRDSTCSHGKLLLAIGGKFDASCKLEILSSDVRCWHATELRAIVIGSNATGDAN